MKHELQRKLDETLLYATSALEQSQFATRLNNYQFWCFFDDFHNPYWAMSNYKPNGNCFDIQVFKLKDTFDGLNLGNAVAECNCVVEEQNGKKYCYIDLLWVKDKACQGKGLGTTMLNMVQLISAKNNMSELGGCMKAFTQNSTPAELREFYLKKGFRATPHKCNNGKTATLRKEISKEETEKLENSVLLLEGYGIPFYALTTPELKPVYLETQQNYCPTLTK